MKLALRWAGLTLAVWVATSVISGVHIKEGVWNYFWIAALFGLINTFLGSLIKLLTLPAVLVSFGLFLIVVNAAMLQLTDRWSDVLTIDNFRSALLAALIISLVSGFSRKIIKKR
jgi:putative membrane protein